MFTAYFDASGNKRKTVLTVAGFVSRVSKWDRFEREWPVLLESYGLSSFHMTDFVSSEGQFKDWKGKYTAKRKKLIEELVACVRRNINKGFATSIMLSDYEMVNAEHRLAEAAGNAYTMCGMMTVAPVRDWAIRKKSDPRKVLYMFEKGDQYQGELVDKADLDGYKIIPLKKNEAQAFQACDMAAWKAMAGLREAEKRRGIGAEDSQKGRELIDSIARSLEPIAPVLHKNSVMTLAKLRLLCTDHKIKRR